MREGIERKSKTELEGRVRKNACGAESIISIALSLRLFVQQHSKDKLPKNVCGLVCAEKEVVLKFSRLGMLREDSREAKAVEEDT